MISYGFLRAVHVTLCSSFKERKNKMGDKVGMLTITITSQVPVP